MRRSAIGQPQVFPKLGQGEAIMYASDLTGECVEFNKGGVGDPASLGG